MNENDTEITGSGRKSAGHQATPSALHSKRFSENEWAGVEKASKERRMTAAEMIQHSALGLSMGGLSEVSDSFPPEIVAQVKQVYRGVSLSSALTN